MKTKLFIIAIFVIFSYNTSFAQIGSKIEPTLLNWKVENTNITLKKASSEGILQPDSLSFEVYFDKLDIEKYMATNVNFEFKWYYYLSTKKKLMDTYVVSYNPKNVQKDGSVVLKSTRGNISKGWWEVQVVAQYDNGLIELGSLSQFQILIK